MFDRHDMTDIVERITCGVNRNLARRSLVYGLVGAGVAAAIVTVLILRGRAAGGLVDEDSEHEWDAASPPETFPDTLREEGGEEGSGTGAGSREHAPRGRRRQVDGEEAPQAA